MIRTIASMLAASVVASCVDIPVDHVSAAPSVPASAPRAAQSDTLITPGLARIAVRDALQKRHLHDRAPVMADLFVDPEPGVSLYESRNLRVSRDRVAFDYDEDQLVQTNPGWNNAQQKRRSSHHFERRFADAPYCTGIVNLADRHGGFFSPTGIDAPLGLLAWQSRHDAQRFCEAWSGLVYHARRGGPDDIVLFAATARGWREHPETLSAPLPGWERHRILAENSYRERDFIRALEHFEAGLRMNPTWEAGWFNAALLYDALGEYEYASNRMRHYLALAPNAPDARAAREKLVVWDEKMRRQ